MRRLVPVCLCAVLTACLFRSLEPPSEPATITGVITRVWTYEGSGSRVLIEEEPGEDWTGDKVIFAVRDASVLLRQPDLSWRRGSVQDLQLGALAQAWDDGDIVDSYPGKAEARVVAVLRPAGP